MLAVLICVLPLQIVGKPFMKWMMKQEKMKHMMEMARELKEGKKKMIAEKAAAEKAESEKKEVGAKALPANEGLLENMQALSCVKGAIDELPPNTAF